MGSCGDRVTTAGWRLLGVCVDDALVIATLGVGRSGRHGLVVAYRWLRW